jgi:hypothetical protein
MCFTHEDPAGDANAKLDKIAVEVSVSSLTHVGEVLTRCRWAKMPATVAAFLPWLLGRC